MNILYHHRTQGKGAEGVHIREIVKGLKELDNEVFVISPPGIDIFDEDAPTPQAKFKLARIWKWVSRHLPQIFFEFLELAYNWVGYKKIKKVLKETKIDFFYERYAFFCFVGVYLAKRYKIPIILEVNEVSGIKRVRGQVLKNLSKWIERIVFKKADAIIVVSSFLKKHIENMGIDSDKIHIIPNAVNIEEFNPDIIRGVEWRERLNLNGKIVLGFVGWFSWWDNLEFLIDAFSEIVRKNIHLHLLLVGDGKDRKRLEYKVEKMGMKDNITFTGRVARSEIPNFIAATDICVIPHSNSFGSPIVLFEYMAMAKPVIAPKLEPIEDVVTHNVNGVLFKPEDKDSFLEELNMLIRDSEKRKAIGTMARGKILEEHTWFNNARKVMDIYLKVKKKYDRDV